MDIQKQDELSKKMLDKYKETWLTPLSEGIHLTHLTGCITKAYWRVKAPLPHTDETSLYFLTGIGFEQFLTQGEGKPEPLNIDGIWMSPDYKDDVHGYTEIKSTRSWINKKTGEPTYGWSKHWIRQIMGYCKGLNVTEWNVVALFIVAAKLLGRKFVFTQGELDEFWNKFIIPRRDVLLTALEKHTPPQPFAYNDDWECKSCEFRIFCEAHIAEQCFIPRSSDTDKQFLERSDYESADTENGEGQGD